MINLSDLKDLLHNKKITNKDKLLLILSVNDDVPKKVKEIKKIASGAGLKKIHKWNVSSLLNSGATYAVNVENGWELNIAGKNYVASKILKKTPLQTKVSPFSNLNFKNIIKDRDLAKVLTLRRDEIVKNLTSDAHLSAVIMMGTLLEGVLLYAIYQHSKIATTTKAAPKEKNGKTKNVNQWVLSDMIDVAHDLGWIKGDVKNFSHVLRDYRNMIHPYHQKKKKEFPTKETCNVCAAVVSAGIDELIKVI